MKIKIAIALLSVITTASIHCSITERINKSKKQLSKLRTKALNGEKIHARPTCQGNCNVIH